MAAGPSQEVVMHFAREGGPPTFLCLLLKMLLDQTKIPPLAYGVLETLSAKTFATQIRTLIDYIVAFLQAMRNDANNQRIFIKKAVVSLNDLVWKYNVIPLDRLLLCMTLRHYDIHELNVLLLIIHVLLARTREFKDRVTAFLAENSPEYWLQSDWHMKHVTFHQNHPELIYFEGIQDRAAHSQKTYLPIYYGNVCLRFLPVFDIFSHRLIELLPQTLQSLEQLLDAFGGLYRFHDRPLTHLYHTLHYYHSKLADNPGIKKKLVGAVLGKSSLDRLSAWCLSQSYVEYLTSDSASQWRPDENYFNAVVQRFMEVINGQVPQQFNRGDWRFLELSTPVLHVLYTTSVELLALPNQHGSAVGRSLLDVVAMGANRSSMSVINAVSLLLTALPISCWKVLNDQFMINLQDLNSTDQLSGFGSNESEKPFSLEDLLAPPAKKQRLSIESDVNATDGFDQLFDKSFGEAASRTLVLCSSFWHHSSVGQLMSFASFIKDIEPSVHTEKQLMYVFYLVAPMLGRFHLERPSSILEIVLALYNILRTVDASGGVSQNVDLICDLFYHIKYSLIGDAGKDDISEIISSLQPHSTLSSRLSFMLAPSKSSEVGVSETA
ncbi:mediator of RNA polymerase II transcription subunit 23-like [Corticium candelabrum]|uniref:mediator of RNA polymerase II transcription subunit 23-like n=1 Tax=Corticium candelabrum TaxID=121492 RepID=UPI002E26151B|nr:mediator of RNA polymerase II transcription subunit 23-like [Corticium candelabrum]